MPDCAEVATTKAPTGAIVDADFKVTFGATDGQPLDGTIDDLAPRLARGGQPPQNDPG